MDEKPEKQLCYVTPSSSARCARFPGAQDKVCYYAEREDFRDWLKGVAPNTEVQEVQYTFDLQLVQAVDPQYCEGSSFSEAPNGQRMTWSFADQIPESGAALTREEEGSSP